MAKNKLVFLSDIHIGNNSPTNWYQSTIHEDYLSAALEYVIAQKDSIHELIILGDLIDFWTYLPSETPPIFSSISSDSNSIAAQNSHIFGNMQTKKRGLLGQAADAVGICSFLHGNHDMTVTQKMLDTIPSNSIAIKMKPDVYFPLGSENRGVVCTHGHIFSMMCAPYIDSKNPISPLPVGYYATRAGAYYAYKQLNGKKNVAELPGSGEPTGINISYAQAAKIIAEASVFSVGAALLTAIQNETKLDWKTNIKLPAPYKPRSLNDAWEDGDFHNLFSYFEKKKAPDGSTLGKIGAGEALLYPDAENDLSSYAAQLAGAYKSKVSVLGHTHVPKGKNKNAKLTQEEVSASSPFIYANCGFNCPSLPDINDNSKAPTFVVVEVDETRKCYTVTMMKVVHPSDGYRVVPDPDIPPLSIPF